MPSGIALQVTVLATTPQSGPVVVIGVVPFSLTTIPLPTWATVMSSLVTAARSTRITMLLLNHPLLDAGVKVTDVGAAYAAGAASRSPSVAPRVHLGEGTHPTDILSERRVEMQARLRPFP